MERARTLVKLWNLDDWNRPHNWAQHVEDKLVARIALALDGERERREFRTRDHPMANGRTPERGEQGWAFSFPLDDGTTLRVQAGKVGREALIGMLHEEAADDALDAAIRQATP